MASKGGASVAMAKGSDSSALAMTTTSRRRRFGQRCRDRGPGGTRRATASRPAPRDRRRPARRAAVRCSREAAAARAMPTIERQSERQHGGDCADPQAGGRRRSRSWLRAAHRRAPARPSSRRRQQRRGEAEQGERPAPAIAAPRCAGVAPARLDRPVEAGRDRRQRGAGEDDRRRRWPIWISASFTASAEVEIEPHRGVDRDLERLDRRAAAEQQHDGEAGEGEEEDDRGEAGQGAADAPASR